MPTHATLDRQELVIARWTRQQRTEIRGLIDDDLLEEHRRDPLGRHSDRLQRVLQFFRRQPQRGKYIVVMTRPWEEYRIGVLPGRRGSTAKVLDAPTFGSEAEALHGIFVRRVEDLMREAQ
jgi:branched-chain amino acid transport system permease protein